MKHSPYVWSLIKVITLTKLYHSLTGCMYYLGSYNGIISIHSDDSFICGPVWRQALYLYSEMAFCNKLFHEIETCFPHTSCHTHLESKPWRDLRWRSWWVRRVWSRWRRSTPCPECPCWRRGCRLKPTIHRCGRRRRSDFNLNHPISYLLFRKARTFRKYEKFLFYDCLALTTAKKKRLLKWGPDILSGQHKFCHIRARIWIVATQVRIPISFIWIKTFFFNFGKLFSTLLN